MKFPDVLKRLDRRIFTQEGSYERLLRERLLDCGSVLDVGCGDQRRLAKLLPEIPSYTGVDMQPPADYPQGGRESYRAIDVTTIGEHFEPGSFDCVVALDLIEHLPRDAAFRLLDAMETIAARKVVICTPNGFLEQPPAPDNPHQEHISGYSVDDLGSRGYVVVGANGWRPLRGAYTLIRRRPSWLWQRVSWLTESFVASRPSLAFHLLGVKDKTSS